MFSPPSCQHGRRILLLVLILTNVPLSLNCLSAPPLPVPPPPLSSPSFAGASDPGLTLVGGVDPWDEAGSSAGASLYSLPNGVPSPTSPRARHHRLPPLLCKAAMLVFWILCDPSLFVAEESLFRYLSQVGSLDGR